MNDFDIDLLVNEGGGGFKAEEFLGARENLTEDIILQTALFRNWTGWMTQITSAWRETGSHYLGKSIDALLWTKWKEEQPEPSVIWNRLTTWPWQGVGIYFDWNDGLGVHWDLVSPEERDRPLRWLRVNGIYYYQKEDDNFYTKEGDKVTCLEDEINAWLLRRFK